MEVRKVGLENPFSWISWSPEKSGRKYLFTRGVFGVNRLIDVLSESKIFTSSEIGQEIAVIKIAQELLQGLLQEGGSVGANGQVLTLGFDKLPLSPSIRQAATSRIVRSCSLKELTEAGDETNWGSGQSCWLIAREARCFLGYLNKGYHKHDRTTNMIFRLFRDGQRLCCDDGSGSGEHSFFSRLPNTVEGLYKSEKYPILVAPRSITSAILHDISEDFGQGRIEMN